MIARAARLIAAPTAMVALGLSATTLEPSNLSLWENNASSGETTIRFRISNEDADPDTGADTVGESAFTDAADGGNDKHLLQARADAAPAARKPARPVEKEPLPPVPKTFEEWIASNSRILIDQGDRTLYFKRPDGSVDSAPIAVGRSDFFTPTGQFRVMEIRQNPTWFPTPSMKREAIRNGEWLPDAVPPGPHNPLGRYFIRFQPEYGIHGTNEPNSIGQAISRGCVRMLNRDVERLADSVSVGDGVTIVSGLKPAHMPDYYYEPYTDPLQPVKDRRYPVYIGHVPPDSLLQPPASLVHDPGHENNHQFSVSDPRWAHSGGHGG